MSGCLENVSMNRRRQLKKDVRYMSHRNDKASGLPYAGSNSRVHLVFCREGHKEKNKKVGEEGF